MQATDLVSSGAGTHENPSCGTVYNVATSSSSNSNSTNAKNLVRFKNTERGSYTEEIVEGNIAVAGGITYSGINNPIVEYDAGTPTPAVPGGTFLAIAPNNSTYYNTQSGFTPKFATFGGVVASIATMGAASGVGLAAMTAFELQGTAMGVAMQNATAVAMTSTASGIARNSLLYSNLGKGVSNTFRSDGLRCIGANALSAGITGGVASAMGVNIDPYTISPINTTDLAHRATYAAINTASQTASDVAILHKKFGYALADNIRGNIGTQVQSAGASALGAAYAEKTIGYAEHKLAHAGLGAGAAAIAGGKPAAGALGGLTAEVVGEELFNRGVNPYQAADVAKVSGSAVGLVTGDVNTAANSAATAVDNNLLPALLAGGMLAEAYWVSQIEEGGGLDQSLRKIGRHEDTINRFTEVAITKGIDLSYEKYPDATMKVLETLGDVADAASATVRYIDNRTGNIVSTKWNSLSKSTQDRLKGGTGLMGITLSGTAAGAVTKAIAKSSQLRTIAKTIAPKEVPNNIVKVAWSKGNMAQGMPWEDFVGTKLAEGTRLPSGFKTFDYFDEASGVATSAKTLDTLTYSKIKRPEQLYSALKKHIDSAAGFAFHEKLEYKVTADMIQKRVIALAIPEGTNIEQYKHIQKAMQYAKEHNIELRVTRVK